MRLVHGTEDEKVASADARELSSALATAGWPVHLDEPLTDHAGIIGTRYDPERRRCVPDEGDRARTGLRASVDALVTATLPDEELGIRRLLAFSPADRLRSLTAASAFFSSARRAG